MQILHLIAMYKAQPCYSIQLLHVSSQKPPMREWMDKQGQPGFKKGFKKIHKGFKKRGGSKAFSKGLIQPDNWLSKREKKPVQDEYVLGFNWYFDNVINLCSFWRQCSVRCHA